MNTLTIKSPVAVLTDGEQTIIITDVPLEEVKGNNIPMLEESITVKAFFSANNKKRIFCHLFPAASVISADLLQEGDRLVDQAIQFKPD